MPVGFGRKIGRFFRGVGKKAQGAYKQAKGFGKKVMKGLDDIGVGDIARDVGREAVETAKGMAEDRGVPVGQIENVGRRALTTEGRRGLVREGAMMGADMARDRLRGMRR